jgi:para-nitrobenzyl esterase
MINNKIFTALTQNPKPFIFALSMMLVAGAPRVQGATPPQSVVLSEQGPVIGTVTSSLRKFLGIPYATPPVGNLRWKPPQAHARWFAPIDTTKFGSHCPQDASFFGIASASEDCLFLNVFTPNHRPPDANALPSHLHPVMVWIHGGGLIAGESDDYDPAKLVEQGDVIVVTINYRVGALGFLAHPALGAESADHASGNYGIMDQQLALAWVQRNIAAFGGDPQNVTIFGESAGGVSVLSHLTSPLAAGLFQRAIVQSGAYGLTLPALADAESQGSAFATNVGCSDQTAECLRSVPVETILANQGAFFGFPTNPNVDGKVLPQSLDTAFAAGQFHRLPLIQGTNHDEMRLLVALDELAAVHPLTRAEYRAQVLNTFGRQAGAQVLAQYPVSKFASPSLALGALETDSIFSCPARSVDQAISALVPTFVYEFNDTNAPEIYLPPVSFPYGAAHGSELPYLFKLPQGLPLTIDQQELSDKMVRYWTQFARSGDPNSNSTLSWPPYNPAVEDLQSLLPPLPSVEAEFATDHKCDFWAKLFGASVQSVSSVQK